MLLIFLKKFSGLVMIFDKIIPKKFSKKYISKFFGFYSPGLKAEARGERIFDDVLVID